MKTQPYNKFSLLPQLNKLRQPLFLNRLRHREKKLVGDSRKVFLTQDCSDEILHRACQYIILHHPLQYYLHYPTSFEKVCGEIWEDVLIHRVDSDRNWLAAIHSSFPNGWLPEDNIGRSFNELHSHIPGMNLNSSSKIVDACIYNGPYERYVWGVFHDDRIDGHPSVPASAFDPNNPQIFIRVETQIIAGLPEVRAFLFILRQHIIREEDIDKRVLLHTLLSMTTEQLQYKRITNDIINYLKEFINV